ncbi:hypothetical protein AK812_SmicGene25803 [Symbiodinium microadriaticum]|uniref:RING-type domain-containing protein n=1 Tax=Symbiodinium microadriaticum TaxID=2951 RepID=A0A1Q9DB45_SYMMI|nr:hypothetical protein AK812_SmicGene25803 [Symbiodinium microadriaticum]
MDGGAPAAGPEIFYWGGPYPVDGLQCYGGTDCDCCCCCPGISWRNCCCCCYPIAWLLFVFPRAPDNAWGGLVGRGDLHEDEDWRSQVYDFLTNGPAGDASYEGFDAEHTQPILQADGVQRQVKSICRSAHAIMIERPFDKTQDRCVESSFNDYMENQCWICQDNQSKEFDLWLSCGHIFCSRCSTEMLRRQMPCPLCRTVAGMDALFSKRIDHGRHVATDGVRLDVIMVGTWRQAARPAIAGRRAALRPPKTPKKSRELRCPGRK